MFLPILLSLVATAMAAPSARRELAPLLIPQGLEANVIADKYIVKLKNSVSLASAESVASTLSNTPDHVFETVFHGFSGRLDQATLQSLRENPNVCH